MDRVESMLHQDFNHASVLIWSLGNESFGGEVFRSMYRRCHELDNSRPVHYEGVTWDREFDDASDIESRMYALPDAIEEYLRDQPAEPICRASTCMRWVTLLEALATTRTWSATPRMVAASSGT